MCSCYRRSTPWKTACLLAMQTLTCQPLPCEMPTQRPEAYTASQFPYLFTYTSYFECISAFTLPSTAQRSALQVSGWCTHNSQKVQCGTLDTSHPQWSPSCQHSGRGGTNQPMIMAAKAASYEVRLQFTMLK